MKISKKQLIIRRSGILTLAIIFVAASMFSLIEPTLTEAAKPRYTLANSIEVADKSGDFGNVDTGADGSVYITRPHYPTNGTTIDKYSPTGELVKSFNVSMRGSVTIGSDNSLYLSGTAEVVGEVVQKYNQNGDILARFTSPDGGYFSNGVAIGSDGTVYVLRKNVTEMYSSNGTYIGKWSHSYGDGGIPSIVVDGNFVYLTLGHDAITKFNLDGTVAGYLYLNNTTDIISQMRINSNGNLLLSNIKSNELIEMTTAGSIIDRTDVTNWPDVQLVNNWKATVDDSGDITIADPGMNIITRFSQTGTRLSVMDQNTDGKLNYGNGSIGTDSSGNIYVSDGKFIQKFDKNGQFIKRIGGGGPSAPGIPFVDGKFSAILRIAVSPSGDIYAYDNLSYQFQKFDSDGNFIARWGSYGSGDGQVLGDIGDMKIGSGGNLYVADNANMRIQVFSPSGQYVTQWSGSTDTEGVRSTLSAIASDQVGNIYTSETSPQGVYPHYFRKYSSTGVLLREWVKSDHSQNNTIGERAFSIAVDSAGKIYTYTGPTPGAINVFDNQGVYESQFKAGEVNFSYQFILGDDNVIIDSGENGIRQFTYQGMTQAPSAIRNQTFASITPNSARVAWDAPSNDGGENVVSYDVEIKKSSVASWSDLEYAAATGSLQFDLQSLDPNTSYDVRVRAVNEAGSGPYLSGTFMTAAIPAKNVTSVNFATDQGKKSMIVGGTGLVGSVDAFEYTAALTRSLITLNGVELPFCSQGIGATAAEIVDGFGVSANLVSDDPTCYMLIDSGAPAITTKRAVVLLADNFDVSTPGTISVNGSNTFAFNQQTIPADEIVDPTIVFNGKPLEGKPTINKRPTFSGVAAPGAVVTVTVRSDPVSCTTTADSNGNWSCTLPSDLPAGDHTVTVTIANPDGSTDTLGPYAVVVPGNGTGATVTSGDAVLAPDTGVFKMVTMQGGSLVFASITAMTICIAALAGFVGIRRFMYRRNS